MSVYIQNFKPTKKPTKYKNTKTTLGGITFDSKAEARRYCELKTLQKTSQIRWFSRQPSFLLPGGVRYLPDFIVCDNSGSIWVEDVKGYETAAFKIKYKLWNEAYAGLTLRVIK